MEPNPFPRPTAETVRSWDGYLYFVYERERVRVLRAAGVPAPWTLDPVIAQYRFTNIRRRDDRMTKWFMANLITPYEDHPDLWFMLLIARIINWPPTLTALLREKVLPCSVETFNTSLFIEVMQSRACEGKIYGDAYMVYPAGRGGVKAANIANNTLSDARRNGVAIGNMLRRHPPTIAAVVRELSVGFGVSTFLAGQVAADLTYCKQLSGASDLYTFAPIGPGSQRGLNSLHDLPMNHKWLQYRFNESLEEAEQELATRLGFDDLTLHDVQNTFCEYSKYVKAVRGVGRPKSMYRTQLAY